MKWRIRRCTRCWAYTLLETCPYCGAPTKIAHPPRFSPYDKYGKYRRLLKLSLLEKKEVDSHSNDQANFGESNS